MNSFEDPRETKALRALVVAALHPFNADAEVSEEEALRFIRTQRPLTEEEQKAVEAISCNPADWSRCISAPWASTRTSEHRELAAMHREKGDEELDARTLAEIERKRAEIREKLRKKRENR